jgi:outer membrane lipoprotein-sorting protein
LKCSPPVILILAMLGIAQAAPSSQPTDPQLWKEMSVIDAVVGKIKDVSADFEQQKFTPLLKKPLISSGHVLGKTDRTLWTTDKPEPTKMLVDSTSIRIYYPEQMLEEIYPIQGQLGALASSPLPRIAALRRFFSFERIPAKSLDPAADDDKFLAIRMLPIDSALQEHVEEVKVLLDRRTGFIARAENIDADGDRTVLTFSNVKVDTNLPDDSLRLDIPTDAKISRPLDAMGGSP